MNKFTLAISDKAIDERLKTYLRGKAVKYLPFHGIQSLLFSVMEFMTYGFSLRFMLALFYFICSVIGLFLTRRF